MHTAGRNKDTQTKIKLKIIVFNDDIRAGQGRADSQKHRGLTSRPDEIKLKRQELNTQGNKHNHEHAAGHELTDNHIRRGQETNQIWTQEAGT